MTDAPDRSATGSRPAAPDSGAAWIDDDLRHPGPDLAEALAAQYRPRADLPGQGTAPPRTDVPGTGRDHPAHP